MKYRSVINIIALVFLFSAQYNFAGEIRDKTVSIIKNTFGNEVGITTFKFNLKNDIKVDSERFAKLRYITKFVYYYEITNNDSLVGYAILDNAIGKVKPITFLTLFDPDFRINNIRIVKYREQYGGEIENKNWLDQFIGKNVDSNYELDDGIDGISGATISVKAISKGIKRTAFLIHKLRSYEGNLLVSIE